MRDPKRIDRIVEKIRRAWKNSPDLRLSQLIVNAACFGSNDRIDDIFYIEDDVSEHGLDLMISHKK